MSSEVLRPACQLAFAVAREGAEATEPIDPPTAMRSFLYVEDLPRRALAAAQQVIEENSEFRHRVALRAEEDEVGRAGFLWLHRPTGWAQEFEVLVQDGDDGWASAEPSDPDPMLEAVYKGLTAEPIEIVPAQPPEPDDAFDEDESFAVDPPSILESPMASISPIGLNDIDLSPGDDHLSPPGSPPDRFPTSSSLGLAAVTNTEQADHFPNEQGFERASADQAALEDDDAGFEADALESELASLRGLVARLANERDSDSPEPAEPAEPEESEPGVDPEVADDETGEILELAAPPVPAHDDDPRGLSADLDAAHHELYLIRADLTIARQEREEAQRLQSEALKRQVQLEKELATVRERKADLEGELSTSQAKAISLDERVGRIEIQLAEVDREREVVRGQLETMTLERNQIRDERTALRAERDEVVARLDAIAEKTGGADIGELVDNHRVTTAELESTSHELARMITQAEQYDEQIKTFTADTTALKSERIDLRSRLGETETALEVTTTQYEALKIDAERMASELGALRAERDGLQSQLGDLQVSLGEVLDEQAEGRQRNDADRRLLNELRVEHDVLLSRLSDVERSEQEAKHRASTLATERDDLLVGRDELLEERGQLRTELSSAAADRGNALERLADVEAKLPPLENELQMERRQREELANRLLELDDMADRTAAERLSLVEERDALAATVEALETERTDAEQFRRERDEMAADLASARSASETALQAMRQQLDEAVRSGEELVAARSEVEQRAADLDDELAALGARLVEVEDERDQAREAEAATAQIQAELEARDAELEDVRSALEAARQDLDEAQVASQVKESELRTVLGARTADGAEIERLKTNLAEAMVRADNEVQEQVSALAARDADLEARDAELASIRTELEAVRAVMADTEDENLASLSAVQTELEEAKAEVEQLRTEAEDSRAEVEQLRAETEQIKAESEHSRAETERTGADTDLLRTEVEEAKAEADSLKAEVEEAKAEADQLRTEAEQLKADLAEARVELASTTAELEARADTPGLAVAALIDGPPVPDAGSATDADDELDSTAAEVRSALRGPSVLDSIADGVGSMATEDDDVDRPVDDVATANDQSETVTIDEAIDTGSVPTIPEDADIDAPPTDELEAELVAGIDPIPEIAPVGEGFDQPILADPVPSEPSADDELDEVSELIARTMSTFSPDELSELGTSTDESFDLAAELSNPEAEVTDEVLDGVEAAGVSSSPPSILGDAPESFRPAERPDLGVSRTGGPKRRRIEVPGDIIDDEVAAARFVVSSPDVVLLVDGDSVAQMGWPKLPVAQQRDALVTYLADLSANAGAAPDVVFDGRIGDGESLPASRAVRIRLSTPPTPPTAALDELVDAYPEQWPIVLVTDNGELAATAGERGAAVLNNGQLLDLFIAE